jgi:hypothetical protein
MRRILSMRLGCYRDKTYCASPDCKNKCGRKMSNEIKAILATDKYGRTSYAYFCGEPTKDDNEEDHKVD